MAGERESGERETNLTRSRGVQGELEWAEQGEQDKKSGQDTELVLEIQEERWGLGAHMDKELGRVEVNGRLEWEREGLERGGGNLA